MNNQEPIIKITKATKSPKVSITNRIKAVFTRKKQAATQQTEKQPKNRIKITVLLKKAFMKFKTGIAKIFQGIKNGLKILIGLGPKMIRFCAKLPPIVILNQYWLKYCQLTRKFMLAQLIVISLLIIIGTSFYLWTSLIANNPIQSLELRNEKLKTEIKKYKNKITSLKTPIEMVSIKEQHRFQFLKSHLGIPLNVVLKKILLSLSTAEVELESFKHRKSDKRQDGHSKVNIQMILTGQYDQVGEYLFFLKNYSLLYNILSISIVPINKEENDVRMRISFDVYY